MQKNTTTTRNFRFHDLAGQRFGRLLVLEEMPHTPNKRLKWRCRCDCGTIRIIATTTLNSGHTRSCGCTHSIRRHGLSKTRTYNSWKAMRKRCYVPTVINYSQYGGRGITVCDRWRDSFENFYEDMGDRPVNTSLDRIDNEKGYFPENCRWATPYEQGSNKRTSRRITYHGDTLTVAEWARRTGVSESALYHRIARGWDLDKAMTP